MARLIDFNRLHMNNKGFLLIRGKYIRKIILIIIPIFLILIAFLLTLISIYKLDGNLTTMSYKHLNNFKLSLSKGTIKPGTILRGEFISEYNNLGIVGLPIESIDWGDPTDEREYVFRIREKGSASWITENRYKTNSFYRVDIFPFGFPTVINSKGKIFEFEFVSNNQSQPIQLHIGSRGSFIVSKYHFSKNSIITNFSSFKVFLEKKIIYSLAFGEVLYSFLLYLCLPIFYLLSIGLGMVLKKTVFAFFFFPILIYIFMLPNKNDFAFFTLISIWVLIIYKSKLSNNINFYMSIFFLLITYILVNLNISLPAEKFVEFAYMFLCIGIIIELKSLSSNKKINA